MQRSGIWLFLALSVAVGVAALLVPRADLPLSHHHFADQRSWLGLPNFGDVASNIVFLVAGLCGLAFLFRDSSREQFIDERERWPYVLVFLGLVLTAFESAYYHLAPDNERLVWDRLPMTVVFMPLVAALITVNLKSGIASVVQWRLSVQAGASDLRFYAAVQVYAVLALFGALLLPPRYTRSFDLALVVAFYAVAKIAETADRQIFSLGMLLAGTPSSTCRLAQLDTRSCECCRRGDPSSNLSRRAVKAKRLTGFRPGAPKSPPDKRSCQRRWWRRARP